LTLLVVLQFLMHQPALVGDPNSINRAIGVYFEAGGDGSGDGPGGDSAGEFTATIPGDGVSEGDPDGDPSTQEIAASGEESRDSNHSGGVVRSGSGPPVALLLPQISSPRIGLGPGSGLSTGIGQRDGRDFIRSTGTSPGGGSGGTGGNGGGSGKGSGGGGTSFFGQKAKGERFVYLLDASGSMYDYNAIAVAKAELLASLAQLDADQQFQVIFYSERVYPMVDPGNREQMFHGTDANRTKASQFVRGIQPLEGTRHREALLEALNYSPDVIFFLTDAGEPRLDAADLDRIRRRSNGKARIHCIEFGKGAALNIETNFLKKLARENGGGYTYRDITSFQKE
jgi:Ca-activated chloride channel family protein